MIPKVSILLPNLNNRPYLEERIQSISKQTLTDWELIIIDNNSDDGAWEFFLECEKQDPRIRLSQAPRQGMYANWNNCIRQARGEYVYIATSDDTMSHDFLRKMVTALDEYPECDLAHCKLKIIDEDGEPHPTLNWDKFYCTAYFGELIDQKHIRLAPHDGLLHCGVKTVYTSITQLLIRRRLFDRIGLFLTNYGSIADFEWDMRASLIANTVHIPEYLATWRVHRAQGTDHDFLHSSAYRVKLLELIDHAFTAAKKINPVILKKIKRRKLKKLYLKEMFVYELKEKKAQSSGNAYKFKMGLKCMFFHPRILYEYYRFLKNKPKHPGKPFINPMEPVMHIKKILIKYRIENPIRIIP